MYSALPRSRLMLTRDPSAFSKVRFTTDPCGPAIRSARNCEATPRAISRESTCVSRSPPSIWPQCAAACPGLRRLTMWQPSERSLSTRPTPTLRGEGAGACIMICVGCGLLYCGCGGGRGCSMAGGEMYCGDARGAGWRCCTVRVLLLLDSSGTNCVCIDSARRRSTISTGRSYFARLTMRATLLPTGPNSRGRTSTGCRPRTSRPSIATIWSFFLRRSSPNRSLGFEKAAAPP
mmetsp:Transcript_58457/g.94422  ORF Transcript_58457/g.94422 Transcript_58457/m.94422 type:complete len:234 (-) Transcript_58457:402-1103(-)